MYTTGGRGGDVYEVTTLADSGPGSLREGVARSNTTIVFRVGGTIYLESPLKITGSNLTIAGQTAPGEGITVAGYDTSISGDNIIIRYMRFRLGDLHITEADAFGGRYHKNIIIDHCSFSWSVDEVLSLYVNDNTTVQWSIISESMTMTTHQKGRHGYGGIWGGNYATFHHNLIVHNVSRNPRFAGTAGETVEFYNNVIYNWGFFSAYGGEEGSYNIRNNYYKFGPNTNYSARSLVFVDVSANARMFLDGNYVDGYPDVTADNWKGTRSIADLAAKLTAPIQTPYSVEPEPAITAYERVLEEAGATLPRRDAIDARVVQEVEERGGGHINSVREIGGYLTFETVKSTITDNDHDGMPDDWELAQGLDPANPDDRNNIHESGYTYLEVYLNGITGNGSKNPSVKITSPQNHLIANEGDDVVITAEAADSDGEVAKVLFFVNDQQIGEDDAAPYSVVWENVPDGTYYLTARAIDDTGTSTQSSSIAVHVNKPGSIDPWQAADIGSPGIAGHTQLNGSVSDLVVKSAGDIGGNQDNFQYAYRTLSGNGEIIARVEQVEAVDDGAEAGLMIRSSLNDDARFVAIMIPYVKYGQKSMVLKRLTDGANVVEKEPETFISTPYWLKLARLGNEITALASPDGQEWTVVDRVTLPLGETAYFGLAADASKGDNDAERYNASIFSNVAVQALHEDYPTSPTSVQATPGEKSVTLTWSAVSTAATYHVYRGENPGGPYELVTTVNALYYTDTGLVTGKTYFYVITAENSHGESFHSDEVSAVPEGIPDIIYYVNDDFENVEIGETPSDYAQDPSLSDEFKLIVVEQLTLSTGNDSDKVLMLYDIGSKNLVMTRSFTPQKESFIVEFDVTAQSWPGTSTVMELKNAANNKTALSIQLRNPDNQGNTFVRAVSSTWYKLANVPQPNRWYHFKLVVNVPGQTVDIYIDNELVEDDAPLQTNLSSEGIGLLYAKTPGSGKGTMYFDNIKVYVEPVPSPNGLAASPGNGMVQLEWLAVDGAATYTVKRSETDGGPYTTIANGITETFYIDDTVVNGVTYYYVVTATGPLGESGPSNQAAVTPSEDAVKPEAPAGLAATQRNAQIDLEWNPVDKALYYTVKRSLQEEGPYQVIAASISGTSYRDGGLDNDTAYYYVVSATSIGGEGDNSAPVLAVPRDHLTTPAVTASITSNGGVILAWNAVEGAEYYRIERADHPEGPYSTIADMLEGTAYLDADLRDRTPYYYKVTAYNAYASSLASEVTGIRAAAAGQYPDAPTGLEAIPGDGEVELTWQPVTGATSYNVRRSESPDGPFAEVASGVTNPAYTDTGLVNGTPYYYLVTAVNEYGESASSVTVREVPATVITVAADGSGQYTRVQDAVNAVPDNSSMPTIIKIKNGIYREKILVSKTKKNLRIIGEDRDNTILVYGDSASTIGEDGKELGTSGSYSFRVEADDFTAEHLTIQNDAGINAGQAVAMYASANRLVFRDVRFLGHQDTLYAHGGSQYYVDCYIEGTVDFIFGGAAAVFYNSTIHSVGGGYVTAASTADNQYGYVFYNSRITANPGVTGVALGRPWRPYSNVIFINSYLSEHISPTGWNNWGNAENEKTARYGEFASYGPGANAKSRFSWTKQLTLEEAMNYLPEVVLAASDGWNPAAIVPMADSNTELAQLSVNGVRLAKFHAKTRQYVVILEDANTIPVVSAQALSDKSTVLVDQASAVPGTAVVRVTAQDGSVGTYVVTFELVPDTTPPVITLVGDALIQVAYGAEFKDPGATATDDRDGDITGRIVVTVSSSVYGLTAIDTTVPDTYTIHYNVTDTAGNRAVEVTRTVIVLEQVVPEPEPPTPAPDTTPPVITLLGNPVIYVTYGAEFKDPGATATDDRDGDLTQEIVVTVTSSVYGMTEINTKVPGTYTIHYNVSDKAGNHAQEVTRTVIVGAPPSYDPAPSQPATETGADETVQFVRKEDLIREEGRYLLKVEEDKEAVLLPADILDLIGDSSLTIQSGELSIELSTDLLQSLLAESGLPAEDGARIKLSVAAVDEDEAQSLIQDANGNLPGNVNVSAAGPVYRFQLSVVTEDGEINVSNFKEPLTLYFPLDEGANPDLAGVYYITPEGELEYIGGTVIDGVVVVQINHFSHYAVLEYHAEFSDVNSSRWAAEVIKKLAAKHIVKGVSADRFAPEGMVTRAELVTLITRALGLTADVPAKFTDVPADAWYADAVAAAYQAGIVKGRSDTVFDPSGKIIREEMAIMILRAYEYATGEDVQAPNYTPFIDFALVSEWATDAVRAARFAGLIQGKGDGIFAPQEYMTRAEAAQIIWNLLTKLN